MYEHRNRVQYSDGGLLLLLCVVRRTCTCHAQLCTINAKYFLCFICFLLAFVLLWQLVLRQLEGYFSCSARAAAAHQLMQDVKRAVRHFDPFAPEEGPSHILVCPIKLYFRCYIKTRLACCYTKFALRDRLMHVMGHESTEPMVSGSGDAITVQHVFLLLLSTCVDSAQAGKQKYRRVHKTFPRRTWPCVQFVKMCSRTSTLLCTLFLNHSIIAHHDVAAGTVYHTKYEFCAQRPIHDGTVSLGYKG